MNWHYDIDGNMTNLYIWAPIPIYTERADYRSLEMAIIQEWQPRLNYPFICQFFHPKKVILKKPALNTNTQFGLATLWHRAKHRFTPAVVRQILTSERFQNRLELWTIIHALGSNTIARFEQTKMLRIQRRRSYPLLCSSSPSKPHPRAISHSIPSGNREFHQMVERDTCTQSYGTPCPMVPDSKPPTKTKTVPSEVASLHTKSHATHHPSKWCSSNIHQSWTNCATTNRPLRTGQLANQLRVVARTGNISSQPP